VVVLGGGITGLFVAYYLLEGGHTVTLVEARREGLTTSAYNGGFITPSFSPAPPIGIAKVASTVFGASGPLYISLLEVAKNAGWFARAAREGVTAHETEVLELGARSLQLYREFFEKENLQPERQKGIIGLYKQEGDARRLALKFGGRFVGAGQLTEMGYVGFGGAVMAEDEISIDPASFCESLLARLRSMGVDLRLGEKGTLARTGSRAEATLSGGERLEADSIVVASGAMSKGVLAPLGYDPRVLPARGFTRLYDGGGRKIVPMPSLLEDYGIALVQHESGTVRLTSFFEMTGFKEDFAEDRISWLETTARTHLPAMAGLRLIQEGTGFRPCTSDQMPVIGRVPQYDNLFVATGNCRLGVTLAPVTAYIIRSMMDGVDPVGVAWRLFDPARFA
jgi:D-amino-acid dehydrogenase